MTPFRMFAVFDEDTTARPPRGLDLDLRPHHSVFDEETSREHKRKCSMTLDECYAHSRPDSRQKVELGDGNGFTFELSPFCHHAHKDGVSVLFSGEVAEWPGIDMVQSAHDAFIRGEEADVSRNDATWLLDFYDTFKNFTSLDITDEALDSLARVRGQFAFIIYDQIQRRVLAARDRDGTQPLYWGGSQDGRFMFGTDLVDLMDCNPSATPFPAGTLYCSDENTMAVSPGEKGWVIAREPWPGHLMSFVRGHAVQNKWRGIRAIPRLDAQGMMCGAVYRVASERSVAGLVPDIA
ncbi:hypothetical protein WJX72_000752 [[Myrmecia] bisecta]|uniref:DUF3700 domain-containing protein n=1 Tax=[Myrmecia] bisecta TaxID=41462 RepID=A0AAW1R4E7_9CHLO